MDSQNVQMSKAQIVKSNLFWGFVLWLFGYLLGIVFFAIVPQEMIGWAIMPFGVALTLWVLFKKIERPERMCYFGVGLFWVIIAVALDYLFIVKLFNSTDYYKLDVYAYYSLTFAMPMAVGWYKFKVAKDKAAA